VRRAIGVLLAVLALGACGVPDDSRPRVIGQEEAAVDLSPSTTEVETEGDDTVHLFFIDRSGATPVLFRVNQQVTSATPMNALNLLLQGPPEGLSSSIPPGTTIRGTSLPEDGTLTIDLADTEGGLLDVGGDLQTEAFAQIVWTVTRIGGVRAVRFVSGDEPVQVPRVGAEPTTEPVDRDDYASLAPGQGG
jgi:spore germination protein GerM